MKIKPRGAKVAIFLYVGTLVVVSLTGFATAKRSAKNSQQEFNPVTDTLPPVISKVKKLKVVKATIEKQGKPNARAVLEIKNNSDKAVTGLTITSSSFSIGSEGGLDSDEAHTVIEPRGTITIYIPLANLEKNVPVIVAAVLYADGSEDGEDIVLEMMHDMRAREKEKREAKKNGGPQQ